MSGKSIWFYRIRNLNKIFNSLKHNFSKAIVVANGEIVDKKLFYEYYNSDTLVICCDGAFKKMFDSSIVNIVIGDMDSINSEKQEFFNWDISFDLSKPIKHNLNSTLNSATIKILEQNLKSKIKTFIQVPDQNTNDLTKAILFLNQINISDVIILGASGLREDHFLGNFTLLFEYAEFIKVKMISEFGVFTPIKVGTEFKSRFGEPVSLFSINATVTTRGLKYPLNGVKLASMYHGTLNKSVSNYFKVVPIGGVVIIYQAK